MLFQYIQVNAGGLSFEEILKCVEEGEIEGTCPKGVMQHYSKEASGKTEVAFQLCFKAAENGSACAQAFVGYCFIRGLGVKQSGNRSFYWYKLSADKGHAIAQYSLGNLYSIGRGTHKSYRRAAHWYLLSAEQNHPEAMLHMARIYRLGKGVKKNYILSFVYLERAASTNLASAKYMLGIAYVYGSYGKMDVEYGVRLLESAAENGILKSKNILEDLNKFYVIDPHMFDAWELPDGCQIPLRRKTIMLMDQVGLPLYSEMADDVRDFVAINPEAGFHFIEYAIKLAACVAQEKFEENNKFMSKQLLCFERAN